METSPIDDLYGDLGHGLYDSALCHDEDSVDIYSGLEDSPRGSKNTEKNGSLLSPRRLKESMDLYEQLITEEQKEKDSTYNELKTKFDAAQHQVQELLTKLEQMQRQNSNLYKENTLLKKNFSAFIKTARMEIVRKDEEISQLSNRRSWGGFHQNRVERSQVCTRRSSGPVKESQARKKDGALTEPSQHKDESRLSSPPVCPGTSTNATPSPFPVLPRCTRSDPDSSVSSQNKGSDGLDSMYRQRLQNHKHVQSDQTSVSKDRENASSEAEVLLCSETSGRQLDGREKSKECLATQLEKQIDLSRGLECHSKPKVMSADPQSKVDKNQSQKERREPSENSSSSSNGQCQQNDGALVLRRSGRSKSPSSQPQPGSTPTLHSQTSRGSARESTDAQTQGGKVEFLNNRGDQPIREPEGSDVGRGARGSVSETSCKSKLCPDRNEEKSGNRGHNRKEERRSDVKLSERRRTRSDGSREHSNTRQSDGRNRQDGSSRGDRRSTRSETSKEHERRSTKGSDRGLSSGAAHKLGDKHDGDRRNRSHADVRENRRDAPVKPGVHFNDPSRRKGHEQVVDKLKASGRTEERSARSRASCDHSVDGKSSLTHGGHASSDRSSVKEKCVERDQDRRRTDEGQPMTSLDRKSKDSFLAEVNTRSASPEKYRKVDDGHPSETVQAERVATTGQVPLASNASCEVEAMTEESSPKRKLTFMETLNLTLSPVKKQNHPVAANEPNGLPPEDALEGGSPEAGVSFELGEEFCVIDEIENSQLSVEATENSPVSTSDAAATHLAPSGLDVQPNESQDVTLSSAEPSTSLQDPKVKNKELAVPQRFDGDTNGSLTAPLEKIVVDPKEQGMESITEADYSDKSATGAPQNCTNDARCELNEMEVAEVEVSTEDSEAVASPSVPLFETVCKELKSQFSTNNLEEDSVTNSSKPSQVVSQPDAEGPVLKQNDKSQQEVSTSVDTQAVPKTCCDSDTSISLEVVSSTVSVDSFKPQTQDYCTDTQTDISVMEITGSLEKPLQEPWAEVVNISSTCPEEGATPLEQTATSEPDSTENEGQDSKPSSSTVLHHDEDSMLLLLSNIKVIPEAISPLTSPVRQTKKVQEQPLGKEQHVKSLGKDFAASAIVSDKDVWKMDMNKENKRPSSPATPKLQEAPLSSSAPEEDLEEGEIVSESDDEGALVIQSPQNEKPRRELRTQSSPRSPGLEKQSSQIRSAVTPKRREQGRSASASKDSPTLNRRRFKTVTAPSKANIATSTDFMNTLSFIRSELRRKYMKLHKNVTKTAFCCIVDMSLASFTEFVDGTNFHRFCCQGNDIKPRLNKIIASVMSKVSSNGIVNRIFDQRADDLKQKLWNFVDGQFDFLFKELKAALKTAPELSKNRSSEDKCSNTRERNDMNEDVHKAQNKEQLKVTRHRRIIKAKVEKGNAGQESQPKPTNLVPSFPCRVRGLGSSGKNIKAIMEDVPQAPAEQAPDRPPVGSSSEKCLPENFHAPENVTSTYTRRLSYSGSVQDKSDLEIFTEQQASSLTFNLVTDSQMGDIFKCLLQGSDLLEGGIGDHQSWPLNTPRKEGPAGENLIGMVTPSKILTPSKLITWTSISPYKFTSPNCKIQMPLNPAFLDENCLLEIPLNHHASPVPVLGSSQQPFSILTEDLAVSLTIPSPLKSDGHLSFLHPASEQPLCAPSSVITAHYGEDALLDGEDATEQDIHLSLDTDNSSCRSSTSGTWDGADPATFQFKPNLPMQAEIMERSNDHFIVRIRHTSPGACEEPVRVQQEASALAQTALLEDAPAPSDKASPLEAHPLATANETSEVHPSAKDVSSDEETGPAGLPTMPGEPAEPVATDAAGASCTSDAAHVTSATAERDCASETKTSRKRRKHQSGPKEKRSRRERSQDKHQKQRHKKRSKSSKHRSERTPLKKVKKTGSPQLSPNSLSAKNVVRKRGEVVVTWTREEDRDILLDLKMKGATPKTFTALSTKLRKSPAQIEDRFTQLMKLFKKKEKLEC